MKRTGLIFGLLGLLLITAVWYLFALKPVNEKIHDTEAELQTEQESEVLLRTRLSRLKKIKDNELSYISAIGALEAQIPPTPQTPALIDDLSALADQAGVEWLGFNLGNPAAVEAEDVFEIPITLRIKGQFFEVLGYLYGVSDLERLVRVDGIQVAPAEEDGFTMLTVTVNAKAFTTSDIVVPEVDSSGAEVTTTTTPSTTTTTAGGGA